MNVTIVVNSCDAYSDLWDLFLICMSDYWCGCKYPIVINTERKNYTKPNGMSFDVSVHNFESEGADIWGERLISTLKDTNSEFVIMLYDDFLLNGYVDQQRLSALVDLMSGNPKIDVVYLTKLLGVQKKSERDDGLAPVAPKADYRLNSAPAIWRKDALLKFTGRKDNPWAWEYFGSYRTFSKNSLFLAVADSSCDIYPYDYRKGGAIYRGKWVAEVINPIIEKHKLPLDIKKRGFVDSSSFPKRGIAWKCSFLMTGAQMIGPRIVISVFRLFRGKLLTWLRKTRLSPFSEN